MTQSQRIEIEEGIARLATRLSDDELDAAGLGEFGEAIRLLTLPERIRRHAQAS